MGLVSLPQEKEKPEKRVFTFEAVKVLAHPPDFQPHKSGLTRKVLTNMKRLGQE
jgi:hypothetical protein